jgi:hypothetical protein
MTVKITNITQLVPPNQGIKVTVVNGKIRSVKILPPKIKQEPYPPFKSILDVR